VFIAGRVQGFGLSTPKLPERLGVCSRRKALNLFTVGHAGA
jgi:hypothetical protein